MKQLPENEQKTLDIVKEACVKYARDLFRELLDKGFIVQTEKRGACPMLRRAGIDVNAVVADDNCLECPVEMCFLMGKNHAKKIPVPEETPKYYQCNDCGDIATLDFTNGKLEKTRKFHQEGTRIIHSCGGICRRKG